MEQAEGNQAVDFRSNKVKLPGIGINDASQEIFPMNESEGNNLFRVEGKQLGISPAGQNQEPNE